METKICYRIDSEYFRSEIKSKKISIRELGRPNSPHYIGITEKTIRLALKNKRCSMTTAMAMSNIVNLDRLIIDSINIPIRTYFDHLVHTVALLSKENEELHEELSFIKQAYAALQKEMKNGV